ncbi:MAG TPA: hypothetical protein VNT51_11760, partial [Miltoncostaeaceae bacterium]|nr:hypothetical protein [Miltoncostaeaceae bacterium]
VPALTERWRSLEGGDAALRGGATRAEARAIAAALTAPGDADVRARARRAEQGLLRAGQERAGRLAGAGATEAMLLVRLER